MRTSNQPESLQEVLRLARDIVRIAEGELYPGAEQMDKAATHIAADVYLILREGLRPSVSKDFNDLVSNEPGRRFVTKLVNWCVQDTPPRVKGVVQESKNEIASTVEILHEFWKPLRIPTFEQTVAEIESRSEGKGIVELHRRWMNHLSEQARKDRQQATDLQDDGKLYRLEKAAAACNMSLEEYRAKLIREETARKEQEDAEIWDDLVRNGIAIELPSDIHWLRADSVFIEHNGSLVRLSSNDSKRVRECVVAH